MVLIDFTFAFRGPPDLLNGLHSRHELFSSKTLTPFMLWLGTKEEKERERHGPKHFDKVARKLHREKYQHAADMNAD